MSCRVAYKQNKPATVEPRYNGHSYSELSDITNEILNLVVRTEFSGTSAVYNE